MALAIWPARQGQQRSLRKMPLFLSWAWARSPGGAAGAGGVGCFLGGGLVLAPVRGEDVFTGAGVALAGEHN